MTALAGLLLALALALALPQSPARVLAPGEGRETVERVCTVCHTVDNIVASHMSRKSWDATLDWMQATQGLGPLDPDIRTTILDYLETAQGLDADADSGADFGGSESPWARPLYRPNPFW